MAKKKATGDVNKSQAIREHLDENPSGTPTEIVAALGKKGIQVSVGLVSNVKYTSGHKARRKNKTAKKKPATGGKKRTVKRRLPSAQTVDISTLRAAAKYLAIVGDAETATTAIKQVQSLQID